MQKNNFLVYITFFCCLLQSYFLLKSVVNKIWFKWRVQHCLMLTNFAQHWIMFFCMNSKKKVYSSWLRWSKFQNFTEKVNLSWFKILLYHLSNKVFENKNSKQIKLRRCESNLCNHHKKNWYNLQSSTITHKFDKYISNIEKNKKMNVQSKKKHVKNRETMQSKVKCNEMYQQFLFS